MVVGAQQEWVPKYYSNYLGIPKSTLWDGQDLGRGCGGASMLESDGGVQPSIRKQGGIIMLSKSLPKTIVPESEH